MAAPDLLTLLDLVSNRSVDLGGAPRPDDAKAIAQLQMGGGSASIESTPLFGGPAPDPVQVAATRARMGGFGAKPNPALSQAILEGKADAQTVLNTRIGQQPSMVAPVERPMTPLRPAMREVLDTADQITTSLTGKGSPVDKTLLPNPYGPGSYDPNDAMAVADVRAQGARAQQLQRAREVITNMALDPAFKGSQGEIVKSVLESVGVLKSDAMKEFEKAKAKAEGEIAGDKAKKGGLDDLLTPEDAGRLGVAYGTTKREAAAQGAISLTAAQRGTLQELGKARTITTRMFELADTLKEKYGSDPGFFNRLAQGAGNKLTQMNQTDPELAEFNRLREGFLSNIARGVGAEKGNLTKEDVERAKSFFPDLSSWTPDTKKTIEGMRGSISSYLDEMDAVAMGDRRIGTRTAPGATKQLDRATAQSLLDEAGGDKAKARALAKERGFNF